MIYLFSNYYNENMNFKNINFKSNDLLIFLNGSIPYFKNKDFFNKFNKICYLRANYVNNKRVDYFNKHNLDPILKEKNNFNNIYGIDLEKNIFFISEYKNNMSIIKNYEYNDIFKDYPIKYVPTTGYAIWYLYNNIYKKDITLVNFYNKSVSYWNFCNLHDWEYENSILKKANHIKL